MPHTTERKTNEQIVREIMNYSSYGALSQLFVMDALIKHADKVSAADPASIGSNGLISPEAWIGVAKEIKRKLDRAYGPPKSAAVESGIPA